MKFGKAHSECFSKNRGILFSHLNAIQETISQFLLIHTRKLLHLTFHITAKCKPDESWIGLHKYLFIGCELQESWDRLPLGTCHSDGHRRGPKLGLLDWVSCLSFGLGREDLPIQGQLPPTMGWVSHELTELHSGEAGLGSRETPLGLLATVYQRWNPEQPRHLPALIPWSAYGNEVMQSARST